VHFDKFKLYDRNYNALMSLFGLQLTACIKFFIQSTLSIHVGVVCLFRPTGQDVWSKE